MIPVAPPTLAGIASRVEERLRSLIDAEQAHWQGLNEVLSDPFDAIRTLVLAGGKRLRPAFCHWGFVGAGGDPDDPAVIDAGAALELLHAFALFHDDVMDDSDTRRGEPTVHTLHAQRHGGRWAGDARRYGEGVAILVGDLTFVYADQLMRSAPLPAWDIWNELRIELNIGQYLDIVGSAMRERRWQRAEQICRYKSGKYTIERPLQLGVAMALPSQVGGMLGALSAYGLPLGDAFQMRDDVLGVFGDTAITGKPVADDLREGKPTPLLALATEAADASQTALLDRVGAPDLSDDEIAAIQQVIVSTGALDRLEDHITQLTAAAVAALDAMPLTPGARDELRLLASYVSWRDI
ncbi:MAG TPA: polyprenyl synthetase family protein [Ilumatobacteraceae bacterium]|nr:polyprenyl synthetase family protein [Ilumatobacteraceae bacterium]